MRLDAQYNFNVNTYLKRNHKTALKTFRGGNARDGHYENSMYLTEGIKRETKLIFHEAITDDPYGQCLSLVHGIGCPFMT
jgi:hypothetical protein